MSREHVISPLLTGSMIPYYDNWHDPCSDGWVDIERIYCFDWDRFSKTERDRLHAVFATLPQLKKHDVEDCWWYSDHEDIVNGYLTAGIEPPGLQVYGSLPVDQWREWDRLFQAQAAGLPVRMMT